MTGQAISGCIYEYIDADKSDHEITRIYTRVHCIRLINKTKIAHNVNDFFSRSSTTTDDRCEMHTRGVKLSAQLSSAVTLDILSTLIQCLSH